MQMTVQIVSRETWRALFPGKQSRLATFAILDTMHEMAESTPVCDYEGSDYRARFWDNQGRDYEDQVERAALRRLMPPRGRTLIDIGAGFGRLHGETGRGQLLHQLLILPQVAGIGPPQDNAPPGAFLDVIDQQTYVEIQVGVSRANH